MRQTDWTGPKGTLITMSSGSSQPPRWALLLIDRVLHREGRHWIDLRWTNSWRGGHGRCYGKTFISIHPDAREDRTRYVILHELAHATNRWPDRHGPGFYAALVRIARAEGALRLVRREHVVGHAKAPLLRAMAESKSHLTTT